jgi:non-lysosomal glucosylceramidase
LFIFNPIFELNVGVLEMRKSIFHTAVSLFALILLPTYHIYMANNAVPVNKGIRYSGDSLRSIEFPVGGIGTGNILLSGRGNIKHIEFFNAPNRNELPPEMTFFSIWFKQAGNRPAARVLERELFAPFLNPFGQPRQQLIGLPRFKQAEFHACYPFGYLILQDEKIPLKIELEVYNPFIPLDPERSGIPAAVFNWQITNRTDKTVSVSLAFNMANLTKGDNIYGGNINRYIKKNLYHAIHMSSTRAHPDSTNYAELAILTTEKTTDIQTRWYRGNWWDNAHLFWDDFKDDGRIQPLLDNNESPNGRTDIGTILVYFALQPSEVKTVPFYLCWYVPNRRSGQDYALGQSASTKKIFKNYYAVHYSGVLQVADYLTENIDSLYQDTKKYRDILFKSTYPPFVLDAVSANTAALKTNLLMRVDNGDMHGFEGLGNDFGCCAGTCTHVWNYAQALASLFPTLEQNARKTAFLHDTFENGFQAHRSVFPLGEYWFDGPPAADGQMGNIVRLYREWKYCGDTQCLKKLWPKVKASLEFAWNGVGEVEPALAWQKNSMKLPWDPDKDGIMEGRQHNTYDIDFYGPNAMIGSLYLAALKAAAEMAEALGEPEKAEEYDTIYNSGKEQFEKLLWNGEYYNQNIEVMEGLNIPERLESPPDKNGKILPKYQYGNGCLSDQLLGQYLAHISGLGYILDKDHIKQAMHSIYMYNFIDNLSEFHNVQRVYGLNDEGGLMTCTWPKGNRPALPFVYSDELWTGIEYQAAASMIYSNLLEEGLNVVKTVRQRYAGWNRNPFAEIESGRYYARSLASWSILLALSGFQYDGIKNTIVFAPKINHDNFYTFWSCGNGWGSFKIKEKQIEYRVEYGKIKIDSFGITDTYEFKMIKHIKKNNKIIHADLDFSDNLINVGFKQTLLLENGDVLFIEFL